VALAAAADPRLRAVVLEGTAPNLRENEGWDETWLQGKVALATYRACGLRVDDVDIEASLRRMGSRALLFVVGSGDPDIPQWMTDRVLAAASPPKALYVVQGAGHGHYFDAAGDAYLDRLAAFFDAALGRGD
jgi:fermentation-respiration switch protein FrsA (DUF1100 family)